MIILGIESSCDDTSVALVDCSAKGCFIVDEKTASQINIHKKYGGVVPEIAGRAHAEKIVPLIETVMKDQKKPNVIAVTAGPGLITGLLVGVEAARTLSYTWNIPLIGVNHIEGHIHSVEISKSQILNPKQIQISKSSVRGGSASGGKNATIRYPAVALIVSGGHTELIYIKKQGDYKLLGATKDDAAGECFDKVAKLLGLPYPGGPQVSKLAINGNSEAIQFPRPMLNDDSYNFSFSGLKTSALYWLRDNAIARSETTRFSFNCHSERSEEYVAHTRKIPRRPLASVGMIIEDFCASFEQAIVDTLVAKTIKATTEYKPKTIILAGGVSANKKLRETLSKQIAVRFPKSEVLSPKSDYCMDNAAMIAIAGYYHAQKKEFADWRTLDADPNWRLAN